MPSVEFTRAAVAAIERVRAERVGELALVIGNGCCDSTAPFLFEGYLAGPGEVEVARVADGVPVLLERALEPLFAGRAVVIDVAADPGGDSFSAETEHGVRLTLTRLPGLGSAGAAGGAARAQSS